MYDYQKWNYAEMQACAGQLDGLFERSGKNKKFMDDAFNRLVSGMQAEVGAAFLAAYAEHVPSIELFGQILDGEAQLLRSNVEWMQTADEEIAAEIRRTFGV